MATSAVEQLRSDTGHSITTLSDVDAQAVLDESAALYTDAGSAYAYGRTIVLRRLLASSSKLHDYVQNNSSESASQVFKNLMQLLAYWERKLADAVIVVDEAARPSAARFGRTSRKPARVREWPG